MRRRSGLPAVALAAATALAGCAEGLRFRQDDRLRFVAPAERSLVAGPVRVRWTPAQGRGARPVYAVFVDRPPMAPGEGIQALAEDDPLCRPEVSCPDRRWLAVHGVHLTRRRTVRLPPLPTSGGQDLGRLRRHEVTVVLLDEHGVRQDEAAWTLTLLTRAEAQE